MASVRLSNTAALVSSPSSPSVEHSIRTREISNGTVVSTSEYNSKTGEYRCEEVFHATPPKIIPARVSKQGVGGGPSVLGETMKYLGGK